jgi:hypothetical protein
MEMVISKRQLAGAWRKAARFMGSFICGGALVIGLGSCEGGHDDPPATDVTGAWHTTTWISVYVPGSASVTWNISQVGSALSGNFVDNLNNRGTVGGSISAYTVFLNFTYTQNPNWVVNYEATAGTNLMSGTFRGEGEVKLGNAQRLLTSQ